MLLGMFSQASKTECQLNIDTSLGGCACTNRSVDYYKVLSVKRDNNDVEIKEA